MTNELKPCPCCGADAKWDICTDEESPYWNGEYIECTGCGLTTRVVFSIKEDGKPMIAAAWNRRSPTPGAAELLQRWQDAALDHYTPGWAFDPTNPELMIGNIAREAHPAPGAAAMREAARLQSLIDCACNALTDSICASGNDAATNLHIVGKLRRDAIPATEIPEQVAEWSRIADKGGSDYERYAADMALRYYFSEAYGVKP